jgi:hypothetical protein
MTICLSVDTLTMFLYLFLSVSGQRSMFLQKSFCGWGEGATVQYTSIYLDHVR